MYILELHHDSPISISIYKTQAHRKMLGKLVHREVFAYASLLKIIKELSTRTELAKEKISKAKHLQF